VLAITTFYFTYLCNSTAREVFLGILYGYKMVLQIIALVLALSTHRVKVKGFNDAKYIAAVIYVTSIEVALIIISIYQTFFNRWFELNNSLAIIHNKRLSYLPDSAHFAHIK